VPRAGGFGFFASWEGFDFLPFGDAQGGFSETGLEPSPLLWGGAIFQRRGDASPARLSKETGKGIQFSVSAERPSLLARALVSAARFTKSATVGCGAECFGLIHSSGTTTESF